MDSRTSGSSGWGDGTVSYYVDANTTGIARNGNDKHCRANLYLKTGSTIFIDDPNNMFTPHIYAIATEGSPRDAGGILITFVLTM